MPKETYYSLQEIVGKAAALAVNGGGEDEAAKELLSRNHSTTEIRDAEGYERYFAGAAGDWDNGVIAFNEKTHAIYEGIYKAAKEDFDDAPEFYRKRKRF